MPKAVAVEAKRAVLCHLFTALCEPGVSGCVVEFGVVVLVSFFGGCGLKKPETLGSGNTEGVVVPFLFGLKARSIRTNI